MNQVAVLGLLRSRFMVAFRQQWIGTSRTPAAVFGSGSFKSEKSGAMEILSGEAFQFASSLSQR